MALTLGTLFTIFISAGVPAQDAGKLVCIAEKESSMNPKAINSTLNKNGTVDYGLFQINSIWLKECRVSKKEIMITEVNIACATYIYKKKGIKPWVTHKKCV